MIKGNELYRSVSIKELARTVNNNLLKGTSKYLRGFKRDRSGRVVEDFIVGKSFSRSLKFCKDWCRNSDGIILVMDKEGVRNTNRIVPRGKTHALVRMSCHTIKNAGKAEEFVVGDIKNVGRCVSKILIRRDTADKYIGLVSGVECEGFNVEIYA